MGGRRKSISTSGGRKQKSSERLSVYDFDFDPLDSSVEKEAAKILNRFSDLNNEQFSPSPPSNRRHTRRRGSSSSPVNKYDSLRCFAGADNVTERKEDEEEKKRIEPIVVDDDDENATPMEVDTGCSSRAIALSPPPPPAVLKDGSWVDLDTIVLSSSSNCKKKEEGSLILDDGNDEDEDEDGVEVIETSSWSTSVSNCAENERKVSPGEEVVESGPIRHEIDDLNNKVVVSPDLFQYGNTYCTESRLTFTATSIRVEGSTLNGSLRTFSADCSIHDILSIELEWCGRVETATIDIYLKSEVYDGAGKAYKASASKILHFSVCDPHWFRAQEAIKSLNVRYGDIWNIALQEIDKNAFLGFNSLVIPDPSCAVFNDSFKDFIYPQGDPDAVSISKRDMKLLQPDSFINDTIIDFYIMYLRKKVYPKDQHRFHFFNCFFFRKLADLDKDPASACEGRAAFHRVRKWTRKINLFEKDYIFIPVNYSLHWSLIVICHPGEVAHFKDDESEKSLKVPCILHMDSIRGSHRGLKNLFQSYLWEEWKARCNNPVDDVSSKFLNLQFVSLELPQQENYFDCGLFLLHYLELFLEQAPVNFSPFRMTENSNFLKRNWFLPLEASVKRQHIQKLIGEISEVEYQKVILGEHNIKRLSSQPHTADEQTSAPEVLQEGCRSPKASPGYVCSPNTSLKFISEASPCGVVEQRQILDLELGFTESVEPGSAVRWFPSGQKGERHQKNFLSPIEEDGGTVEQISDSSSDAEDSKKIAAEATEYPATSSFGENCRSRHIPLDELSQDSSASGTSNCVVEDSEDSDSIYNVDTDSPVLHGNSKGEELPSAEDLEEEIIIS